MFIKLFHKTGQNKGLITFRGQIFKKMIKFYFFMRFIATDSAHLGLPYGLLERAGMPYNILGYFLSKIKVDFRTVGIKRNIAKQLDGLECLLSASGIVDRIGINERKLDDYKLLSDKLRKRFGDGFGYYAFHGLFEGSPEIFGNVDVNLADNDTHEKAKGIETIIINQIKIARELSCVKNPILNLHMGLVEDEKYKKERINNLKKIVEVCLGKDVLICFENAPPVENGYNLFQKPEDFEMLGIKDVKVTLDYGHLEYERHWENKGKRFKSEAENIRNHNVFHNGFIWRVNHHIRHIHWSLNDVYFLEGAIDPYYGLDRHNPPSRFINSMFARHAFEPVTRNALSKIEKNMGEDACICMELPRRKVFFRTYCVNGATERELTESYKYARRINESKNIIN